MQNRFNVARITILYLDFIRLLVMQNIVFLSVKSAYSR